jgi:hypothetical protein
MKPPSRVLLTAVDLNKKLRKIFTGSNLTLKIIHFESVKLNIKEGKP